VSSHGAETGGTTEGESSKSSHVEVGVIHITEISLEWTVDLVTAQRSGYKALLLVVTLLLEDRANLVDQICVGKSTWEDRIDHSKRSIRQKILDKLALIVVKLEAERQVVVAVSWRSIDLNSSQNSCGSISNGCAGLLYDPTHQLGLSIVKGVWQLNHLLLGIFETLGIWHKHGTNEVLLGIKCIIRYSCLVISAKNTGNVSGCSHSTSAA